MHAIYICTVLSCICTVLSEDCAPSASLVYVCGCDDDWPIAYLLYLKWVYIILLMLDVDELINIPKWLMHDLQKAY